MSYIPSFLARSCTSTPHNTRTNQPRTSCSTREQTRATQSNPEQPREQQRDNRQNRKRDKMAAIQSSVFHPLWDAQMQRMDAALKSGKSWADLNDEFEAERLLEVESQQAALQGSTQKGRWRMGAELERERMHLRVALGRESPDALMVFQTASVVVDWQSIYAEELKSTPQKKPLPQLPVAPKKPSVAVGRFSGFLDSDTE